jgi:hypothetical protein
MTPESPLDKKETDLERELTLDERVNRLEHVLENAFNQLGSYISEVELKTQRESQDLQQQLSKTLTLMNMSTLQNIVTLRETLKVLIEKEIIDPKAFEKDVTEELTKAIQAQQKAIQEAAQPQADLGETEESGATA